MRPAAISDIYVDMKVLVTGASGYIGRHTLLPLLDSGCDVYAISRRRDVDFEWPRGVNVLTLDLFDDAARQKTFAEIAPQWLLHLAWYTEHGKFWEAQENIAWLSLSIRNRAALLSPPEGKHRQPSRVPASNAVQNPRNGPNEKAKNKRSPDATPATS